MPSRSTEGEAIAARYRDRVAALYDELNPWADDNDFYLDLVMAARSVLDVGCGTGRLLRRARELGHPGRLCGLDPDPAMLDQARVRSDIEWVLADAASASWDAQFTLAVMTGHAFQYLRTDAQVRASLAAIRTAVKPGGRFVFETRNPAVAPWQAWERAKTVELADKGGKVIEVSREVRTVVEGDLVHVDAVFSSPRWDQEYVSRGSLRFLALADLNAFLAEAGLLVEEQFGDWDRSPVAEGSPEIITIACRG